MDIVNIRTPEGTFQAGFETSGLCQLRWPHQPPLMINKYDKKTTQSKTWAHTLSGELTRYFSGKPVAFTIPISLDCGTAFQQDVWQALSRIEWGQTSNYGELARLCGHPRAARAVGAACGANPIPIVIPCHRVLAKNGSIGGWSGKEGGKEKLLRLEESWPVKTENTQ